MEDENRPLVTYFKKADKDGNRILLPKFFVDNNGRNFTMEVYRNKIIIKPITKEEK